MNPNGTLLPLLERIRTRALIVGLAGLGLGVLGAAFWDRKLFDRAYLFSFLFFLGLSLGSMALLMLHRQLGGAWGFLIRRPLESAAMTLPLMAILFAPVLFDLGRIYEWVDHPPGEHGTAEHAKSAGPDNESKMAEAKASPVAVTKEGQSAGSLGQQRDPLEVDTTHLLDFKKMWLTPVAFTIRMAIYFVIWIVMAAILYIGSKRQDATGSTSLAYGLQSFSAPGLVVYFLTTSLALVDWGMSLEPEWYSSLYGVLMIVGQAVSTMSLMIIVAAVISKRGETNGLDTPETFNDLGNLLLAFVMLWAYLSFSQFLIIWAGNLAEEIPWYERRLHKGWENVGRFLMLFHFLVPFLILLSRPSKRNIKMLWKIAALVFVAHLIDVYWLVAPSFNVEPAHAAGAVETVAKPSDVFPVFFPSWLDIVVPVGMGGIWLWTFLWFLKSKPLLVVSDPELLPALKQAGGH